MQLVIYYIKRRNICKKDGKKGPGNTFHTTYDYLSLMTFCAHFTVLRSRRVGHGVIALTKIFFHSTPSIVGIHNLKKHKKGEGGYPNSKLSKGPP